MKLYDYQKKMTEQLDDQEDQSLVVYRESIKINRQKALTQQFPCCSKLVGDDYWQMLAENFIEQYSSRHQAIHEDAPLFIHFLEKHEIKTTVPYLVDMAELEWAWYQVFHGPNNESASYADLQQELATHENHAVFRRAHGLQLLRSAYPLHQIWEMCQPEYEGDYQYQQEQDRYFFAIVQKKGAIYIQSITETMFHVLSELTQPLSLATIVRKHAIDDATFFSLYQRGLLYVVATEWEIT